MARQNEDRFSNLASFSVTMSAANVLTFVELVTGVSLGTGIGMLIDQIDYQPSDGTLVDFTANADAVTLAISTSNAVTNIEAGADQRVIHSNSLSRRDFGTAAAASFIVLPLTNQFFPPMIVASPRLYLGMNTSGLASAGSATARVFFRYITLTDKEYLELAESFILVG